MITATQSGNGWYVEGTRYKIFASKSGISLLYLKDTARPTTNVLYGNGIIPNEAYGATSGTVALNNADSSISLVEANSVRAVLSVTGFYEPGAGGTKYGTGSARIVCYPDRFSIESVSQFTTSLGSGMCVRPVVATFAYNRCKEDYCFNTLGYGDFTWRSFGSGWSQAAWNFAGPLTVVTVNTVGAVPTGLLTVVVLGGQGYTTFDLWDIANPTTYMAWRAQRTNAVTGQRYRAVSIFNFATTSTPNDPNLAPAIAYRDDFTRPDPLSGAANAGAVFTGHKVTGTPGDENSDGYAENDTAYVLQPGSLSGYLDVRFDDRRGTSLAAPFFKPAVRIITWSPSTKPAVYRWSGAAWQLLSEGVDYATTAEADEPGVGANIRVVQILADLSGEGTSGPRFKFVEVYDEPPGQQEWTLSAAGQTVDMAASRVSLSRLANSWRYGRMFAFTQAAAHTQGSWHEGQEVELLCRGVRVFFGDIAERHLVGAPGAEDIVYICRDTRARAEKVSVTDPVTLAPRVVFNAPEGDPDHIDAQSGQDVGDIIRWLFETYEDALVDAGFAAPGVLPYEFDDLAGLTAVPPKIVLDGLHFEGGLRAVLAYEPEVIYCVDPATLKYRFLRLGSLDRKSVTYNSADKALASLVTPTLAGRYTAYRIVGQCEHVTRTAYLSEGELDEYWGGRATTLQNVSPGTNVVIPADNTTFFEAGDSIAVGSGTGGETTTVISISAGASITANLTKSHAAGTVITNKAYLESHWTIARAFGSAQSDAGTVTSGQADRLTDSTRNWHADKWIGAEVTLVKTGLIQKRTVTDSTATILYVTPNWALAPAAGDAYEVKIGVSRYRYVYSRYRVTDEDKRRIALEVPDPQSLAPLPGLALMSWHPRVWRKTASGAWLIAPVVFDYASGVFTTASPAAEGAVTQEGQAHAASDMRLDYAYLGNPCQARYPVSGYTGTAHSQAGLAREKVRYEDDFATAANAPQYQALAEKLLWPLKDIAYTGEIALGITEPEWLDIDYRLDIKAQNDLGQPAATGLESVGALVSAAEIDFAAARTRVLLADAETLGWRGDWFRTLAETELVYEQLTQSGVSGVQGGSGGDEIYITINEIIETIGGGGGGTLGGGAVWSVTGGGDNGIIQVSPITGDVVVSHADYTSGNKTPCDYAPRWQ
jgi:hypothetical protein